MRCSSHKESYTKQLILAYHRQLTDGCGSHDCPHRKCASCPSFEFAGEGKETLFTEAVQMARVAFRKDSAMNTYHFCPNVAPPLHCFRLDCLTEQGLTAAQGPEAVTAVLVSGLGPLECLLHAFPYITLSEYTTEVAMLAENDVASEDQIGLDVASVHRAFQHAAKECPDTTAAGRLVAALVPQLSHFMLGGAMYRCPAVQYGPRLQLTGNALAVRAVLVLLQVPALFDPTHANSAPLHHLCLAIGRTEGIHFLLTERLSVIPHHIFRALVVSIQQCISVGLYTNAVFINETIASASAVLALLYNANYLHRNAADGIVPYDEFYNGAVNDIIDVRKDFIQYVKTRSTHPHQGKATFTFAQHPFMLDLGYKSLLLHFHSKVEQEQEVQNTLQSLMAAHWLGGGGASPLLSQDDFSFKLVVDRTDLVRSTLQELMSKSDRYKKPLRVHFRGEEGVDEGGVRKEFFQLLVKHIFDPTFGMFEVKEVDRVQWFNPHVRCNNNDNEFRLVGLLFGLAIYNSVILDIQFPSVVYKKLLGHDQHLHLGDLTTLDASLAQGFKTLLAFDEDPEKGLTVENTFCRTFSVEYDVFGATVVVDLIENGRTIPLTIANRQEYVALHLKHYLIDSIRHNFDLFKKGFLEVCNNPVLKQIRPQELELLVVGSPVLDFTLLKSVCKYVGYKKTDATVVHFWEIVLTEMDQEQQRKLLKFSTGSDRVPVGGLGSISFVIGKNGGESELLPTSHTCFNHLLLPDYATKDQLRIKLMMAINNCMGFGLM